jgi:hypothetical protein
LFLIISKFWEHLSGWQLKHNCIFLFDLHIITAKSLTIQIYQWNLAKTMASAFWWPTVSRFTVYVSLFCDKVLQGQLSFCGFILQWYQDIADKAVCIFTSSLLGRPNSNDLTKPLNHEINLRNVWNIIPVFKSHTKRFGDSCLPYCVRKWDSL